MNVVLSTILLLALCTYCDAQTTLGPTTLAPTTAAPTTQAATTGAPTATPTVTATAAPTTVPVTNATTAAPVVTPNYGSGCVNMTGIPVVNADGSVTAICNGQQKTYNNTRTGGSFGNIFGRK